jgi:uncharacterized protein (DUF1015 family)
MALIVPFKALRPQPQFAKKVASPPYDVLNSAEAKIAAQGNPNSFLHITKSEIDISDSGDTYSPRVYEKAKENLRGFIQRGVLFREDKPCFYIYRLTMGSHNQTGLVCLSSIDDYENNLIKKHELTRPDKEQDRINHIVTTGAQTGNVFLAYRTVPAINSIIEKWQSSHDPVYDFVAEDGIAHAIWIINSDSVISNIRQQFETAVPATYIADGHHRAASAAKARPQLSEKLVSGRRDTNKTEAVTEVASRAADYFLTTLFPSDQLSILDYNRVVKDLNGLDEHTFLQKVRENFEIADSAEPVKPSSAHEFGMFLGGKWYRLRAKEGSYADDPIGQLDVSVLSNNLLAPILNIHDQRTDKRIDFVGGIRGLVELEKRVSSGEMKVAFSIYPVSIEQLFSIADTDNIMPPKSTWFEPKLRDGLLTHLVQG